METALRVLAPCKWWIVFLTVAPPSCVAGQESPSPDTVGSGAPARIVSLLHAATEIRDAPGAGDRLVAAPTDTRRRPGPGDGGDPLRSGLAVISRISPELILASPRRNSDHCGEFARRERPSSPARFSHWTTSATPSKPWRRRSNSRCGPARLLLATLEDDLRRTRKVGRSAGARTRPGASGPILLSWPAGTRLSTRCFRPQAGRMWSWPVRGMARAESRGAGRTCA